MPLASELLEQIDAYVEGLTDAEDLEAWLDDHVQVIHDAEDGVIRTLSDRVFSLLAEVGLGHRDDDSVRAELARELERVQGYRREMVASRTRSADSTFSYHGQVRGVAVFNVATAAAS